MKYAVIIEKGPNSYGAQVPDLPGCIAVAETHEVCRLIQEAIELYVEALEEEGLSAPEPHLTNWWSYRLAIFITGQRWSSWRGKTKWQGSRQRRQAQKERMNCIDSAVSL